MSRRDLSYAAGHADDMAGELETVDDLQVAAAAAAAAMGAPSSTDSDSSDDSSSEEESSSDDDMDSEEESTSSGGTDEGAFVTEGVNLVLNIDDTGKFITPLKSNY